MSASIGVDVGGTFTDLVAVSEDGSVHSGKVLSTPGDQSEGVQHALHSLAPEASRIARIVHGTTVVTNMLLERAGARVVLCATERATDLLELRRQERASLYDLAAQHPPALVVPDAVVGVDERIAPEGVVHLLTDAALDDVAERVAALAPDIVAVSLLHAYADPAHEARVAERLRARLAGVEVVCSSEVLPEIREYERTATTVCEAYARPGVARYLGRLSSRLGASGYPAPAVMSSSGGTSPAPEAARAAASLALSGPAGGVAGAAVVLRAAGLAQGSALTIDIGGTSADVGLILDGEPLVESGGTIAGVPIALPRVLVETVSAGGGSIGWIDDGGALRVGPRSAGSRPGPVAFGRGGTEPTVTDAHIALGNIRATHMSDGVALDRDGAARAVEALARRLGVDGARVAAAMIATADASMARALRRVSVERGIDPRGCTLVAFGGGGPLHACGLADRVGITRVLVPPHAGVLSALGLALASERRVAIASVMREAYALDAASLGAIAAALEQRAAGAGTPAWSARARYRGQGHELDIAFEPGAPGESLTNRFTEQHRRRYGFVLDLPVEVVSARCTRSTEPLRAKLERRGPSGWNDAHRHDDGGALDALVRGRDVITLPDATLLVAEGWTARALSIGGWMLERES